LFSLTFIVRVLYRFINLEASTKSTSYYNVLAKSGGYIFYEVGKKVSVQAALRVRFRKSSRQLRLRVASRSAIRVRFFDIEI